MTEPGGTVQVPVSLIKDADRYIEGLGLKPTSAQANWARVGYLAGRAHSLSQRTADFFSPQEPRMSAIDAVQAWVEDALETGSTETRNAARDVRTILAREND